MTSSALIIGKNPHNRKLLCDFLMREGCGYAAADGYGEVVSALQQAPFFLALIEATGLGEEGPHIIETLEEKGIPIALIIERGRIMPPEFMKRAILMEKPLQQTQLHNLLKALIRAR
ncbi:MAG: hypothetical protein N3A02_03740 [Rectinema sp.]|nr:hypothetical protein [Rectinema sp.]